MKWDTYGVDPIFTAAISEIIDVCRKHGISIAHEDSHGAFIIEEINESNYQWLRDAMDGRT